MINDFYVHAQEKVRSLMYEVFGWMSFALATTGVTAYYVYNTPAIMHALFTNQWIFFGLLGVQLLLVFILSAAVNRLNFVAALSLFVVYSVITGATLSSLFAVYTMSSLAATFFIAAGMFGGMALYGAFTKTDLTAMGSILIMALWGLVLALFVNLFIQSAGFDLILAIAGVIIFSLLTAFEVQRIKMLAQFELPEAASVALALSLYLNFINLFLDLVRIMGQKKQ